MFDSYFNFYTYENALQAIEDQLFQEKNYPSLLEQLHIQSNGLSVSGLKDNDYPIVNEYIGTNLKIDKTLSIPAELQERTRDMKQNCLMGVYAEIDRLWLTVDSDLFLWNYEQGSDLAYYDGFADTILSVGFIKPKKGIFHPNIQYLLCLAGQVEIVILAVTVSGFKNNAVELLPEPIFKMATDNEQITVIQNVNGRIIMGTKSGNILEVIYWSEKPSWFNFSKSSASTGSKYALEVANKLCVKLINHSVWKLSVLLPSVIVNGLMLNESIVQMAVDSSRNMIYTRSETSLIAQYELLPHDTIRRLSYLTEDNIVSKAAKIVKSVDRQQFKTIVELCPMNVGHGPLQLMAVTKTGVRLYFTDNLRLSHVRMPPMSPSTMVGKVNNVRLVCESRGSVLMVCGSSVDNQAIYTVCPDAFLLPELVETVSVSWANNGSWLLVPLDKTEIKKKSCHPIIQTQHIDPIRRFLMISPESIVQLELPSPIHQLRSILEKNVSPQCGPIKSWIEHYGPEETIYGCLVIASDPKNQFLAARATEAVLYHLNESIKTRATAMSLNGSQGGYCQPQRNPLHYALCMYAARILRPMWDNSIGEEYKHSDKETYIVSSMDSEELKWFMHHLVHLHDFIRDNYPRLKSIDTMRLLSPTITATNKMPIVPLALELIELLKASVEIVGLWSMLTKHQFHLIIKFLTPEMQIEVQKCPIKQLLMPHKRHVLVSIISALLEYYLADGVSTEEVIDALLHTCPNIYRLEDALCSRANEMLVMIDNMYKDSAVVDQEVLKPRKDQILMDAVKLYEQVGSSLDLASVVCRLRAVGCLWGAVHLCLHAANIRDPDQVSVTCLRDNRKPMNNNEVAAVEGRTDAHKYMIECLGNLLESGKCVSRAQGDQHKSLFPASHENPFNDLGIILGTIFNNADDMLAHYEVYSWMIEQGLANDILKYSSTHLESYLRSQMDIEPQSVPVKTILWRLYELNGRLLDSARILENMAVTECAEYSLDERIQCLSRAVVFVKALIGDNHNLEMDYLTQLADKLEIAQLQKIIIDEIGDDHSVATQQLNCQLYNVYTLLRDFAEPYCLTVSKLFILRVSGQTDSDSVKLIWEEFLEREMDALNDIGSVETRQISFKQTLMRVANHFKDSPTFLPLDLILYHLESYCDSYDFPVDWCVSLFAAIDVPVVRVLHAYSTLIRERETDVKRHVHRVYGSLCVALDQYLSEHSDAASSQVHCAQWLDVVAMCLIELQSRSDAVSQTLVHRLRLFKSLLEQRL